MTLYLVPRPNPPAYNSPSQMRNLMSGLSSSFLQPVPEIQGVLPGLLLPVPPNQIEPNRKLRSVSPSLPSLPPNPLHQAIPTDHKAHCKIPPARAPRLPAYVAPNSDLFLAALLAILLCFHPVHFPDSADMPPGRSPIYPRIRI